MSDQPPSVVVTVNGEIVAQAPNIETLTQEATASGASWRVLSGGEQIGLDPMPEATAATGLFTPDEGTVLELDGNLGVGEVVDVRVRLNDRCWGWAQGATPGSWLLLPCEFETQSTILFDFSASQELSMTGMTVAVMCRAMDGVAVARQWDDIEGVGWLEVAYGDDPTHLIEQAATFAFDWETLDSFCPACVASQGWLVTLDYDRAGSEEHVMRALNRFWQPCDAHLASAGEGVDLIGCSLRWVGDRWELVP